MTEPGGAALDDRISAVRRFNRFYTRQIGVLQEGLLQSPFSLTEVRVLYELAHREHVTAAELVRTLGIDAGYLSRILRSFTSRRLITRTRSPADGRQSFLRLTARGRKAFAPLDARASDEVRQLLTRLTPGEQARLVDALRTVEELLGPRPAGRAPYVLRPPRAGELGWVVHRHGALYAEEYGWDVHFEGLVARVVGEFVERFDPACERCWIAERDGEVVGSVFLVRKSKRVAKLRLLYVEPAARGLGIGRRLVEECIAFAREAGYAKITLWTNSVLEAARGIYARAGFRLVHAEPYHGFGHDLVSETWELAL